MANEDENFFFGQSVQHVYHKRYRKMPEDLPEGLKYARLNPKVAAYLANKEREAQKQAEQDPFGDGLGKKSLLPQINSAVTNIKNRFDSSLLNDEDSQRYLFEDAKTNSTNVLMQLARYLYFYEDIASHIPRGLEYQLLNCWPDLTADVIYVPREWQTSEGKEQYLNSLKESPSDEDSTEGELKNSRSNSIDKTQDIKPSKSKKNIGQPAKVTIPDIIEEDGKPDSKMQMHPKRSESRLSNVSASHSRNRLEPKSGRVSKDLAARSTSGMRNSSARKRLDDFIPETPSDHRSSGAANQSAVLTTIQFSMSNKNCEEKGWILGKSKPDEDKNAILGFCIGLLHASMKQTKEDIKEDVRKGYDRGSVPFVHYYGDAKKEVVLKYRKRSPVKLSSSVAKGGKPSVPPMYDERTESKQLLQTMHTDGTSVVYYPSGRPAIIFTPCSAVFGKPGFYTLAFEDSLDSKMLACFTPTGRGVCYGENGIIRVLVTDSGGHVTDELGSLVKTWRWPKTAMKNMEPVMFKLNSFLTFRSSGQSKNETSLVFNCCKEYIKFSLSPTPGAVDSKPGDENEQLLTSFTFCSRAAKDLMRLFAPKKPKTKGHKKKHVKSQNPEIQKLIEFQFTFDGELDKDLARLQRKAKLLVDQWMEHYRIAVGLTSPLITNMPDTPRMCMNRVGSAHLGGSTQVPNVGAAKSTSAHPRAPSAPPAFRLQSDSEAESTDASKKSAMTSAVKFEESQDAGGDNFEVSPTAINMFERLAHSAGKYSSRTTRTPISSAPLSRQYTMVPGTSIAESLIPQKSLCPVVVRQRILGLENPICRCSRHLIPQIMDIEYDTFITMEVPESQLIIVEVISTLFPHASQAEKLMEELHANLTRNRTKPCLQSRSDMYRVLQYDVNTAAEGSDHTQPLLLTRHNVVPGMFLMYMNGKLLFCDHIFNGYGNARKDFKKQMMKTRLDAIQGNSLPADFKFSPSRGRSGMRSAWGGEIGGTGVDKHGAPGTDSALDRTMMPAIHTTSTNSPDSSAFEKVKEIYVRLGPMLNSHRPRKSFRSLDSARFISMSLSPTGYVALKTRMKRNLSAPGRRVQASVT